MSRPKKGQEHPREGMGDRIGMLAAIGTTHDHIARICDMSTATLHKHYKDDLDLGGSKAGAVVGGKIFEAAKRGESWACNLWAARRMGWKETSAQEIKATVTHEPQGAEKLKDFLINAKPG
jgi:hypothetical protein